MARYGTNHKGGRPSKAEEMGLAEHLLANTNPAEVIALIVDQARNGKGGEKWKAIEYLANRMFGKEPKPIFLNEEATHEENIMKLQDFVSSALNKE